MIRTTTTTNSKSCGGSSRRGWQGEGTSVTGRREPSFLGQQQQQQQSINQRKGRKEEERTCYKFVTNNKRFGVCDIGGDHVPDY